MKKIYRVILLISLISFCSASTHAQEFINNVPGEIIAFSAESSEQYIGSPSISILPNGHYVAAHDLFGPKISPEEPGITHVYLSRNKGLSWFRISEIKGQFWSKLFVHKGSLYIIGSYNAGPGNLVIRKSVDNGYTWTEPKDKETGLLREGRYHSSSLAILEANGRIWKAVESIDLESDQAFARLFDVLMISASEDADLLHADSWVESNKLSYVPKYLDGKFNGWLEGNAVKGPHGILNVLRTHTPTFKNKEYAAIVQISKDGKKSTFDPARGFVSMPGATKKFNIQYDPISKLYYTLSNVINSKIKNEERKGSAAAVRNSIALCSSPDLKEWKINKVVLSNTDNTKHGFQYVDWEFEGEDIIFVSRTAFDLDGRRLANNHDANLFTFHRITGFSQYADLNVTSF